jgi:hypothetical protein
MTVTEKEGMCRADTLAHQLFMATLNNRTTEIVVQPALTGIDHKDPTFKLTHQRVRGLFKTWKNRTLNKARKWFDCYILAPSNRHLREETNFKKIKKLWWLMSLRPS